VIPPEQSGVFVAAMETVLDVYKRPYDPRNPVIGMDESPKQLIGETRLPLPARPGEPARHDYEYVRNGVCCIFMACEPLAGKRLVRVEERKTKQDWAKFIHTISETYSHADKITLVMDNLNTHNPGSLYETFAPQKAKALLERFEFVFTPKHGSWLNVAEIELNVLNGQCLNRRIPNIQTVRNEALAWQNERNNKNAKVDWQFSIDNARTKLKRLYPTLHD
jgi:DDE superfamily endonuclease